MVLSMMTVMMEMFALMMKMTMTLVVIISGKMIMMTAVSASDNADPKSLWLSQAMQPINEHRR